MRQPAPQIDLGPDIERLTPGLVALRRELHRHPELAFEEEWTAVTLARRMRALGLAVQEGTGGTGVLAVLEGGPPRPDPPGSRRHGRATHDRSTGPRVRLDGARPDPRLRHDAHSAIVAGEAELLVRYRDRIAGRIAFVFQPADEPMRGARRLIDDGLLGAGHARHVAERARAPDGPRRPGRHPARAALCQLGHNALRACLLHRIEEVAGAVARAAGGTLHWKVDYALPALVNDDRVMGAVERAAERVIGRPGIVTGWREAFSDDFGLFMAAAPGCFLLLGTANPDKGITEAWHRPDFDVDKDALPLGTHIMALAALDLLR